MAVQKDKTKLTMRQKNALETKRKLYESAMILFQKKGYHAVSIDEIVTLAGTSKGSFYTHFESKTDVIMTFFNNYDNHYLKFHGKLAACGTAMEKLLCFVENMFVLSRDTMGFDLIYVVYGAQLSKKNKDNSRIIDKTRPLYQIMYEIMENGQRSGEFRNDISADTLVQMAIRSMRGTLYDWCLYNGEFDLIEAGVIYFRVFIDGIKNKSQ